MPGEAFGSPGYMRLSFALGDDDLVVGVERLQELLRLMARILVTEEIADGGARASCGPPATRSTSSST